MDEFGEDKRIIALHNLARRVVKLFHEAEPMYVILDRADRCRDWRKTDHRKALLDGLIKMVEAARSQLRILVVTDGSSWPVERHQDEFRGEVKDRVIIHVAEQEYADQ